MGYFSSWLDVTVEIPQKEALRRGSTIWGRRAVYFDAVVDLLKDRELDVLHVSVCGDLLISEFVPGLSRGGRVVQSPTTDPLDVAIAIKRAVDERAVERAEFVAELTDDVKDFLSHKTAWRHGPQDRHPYDGAVVAAVRDKASTLEALGCVGFGEDITKTVQAQEQTWTSARIAYLREIPKPARIGSAIALHSLVSDVGDTEYAAEITELIETIRAEDARIRAIAAEEEAQEKRVQSESRLAWREWAALHGSDDVRAAIENSYPLGLSVEREVAAHVMPAPPSGSQILGGKVDDLGDRRVPSETARSLRAERDSHVGSIAAASIPIGAVVGVGRIRSVTHEGIKKTAVPVTLAAPHFLVTRWYAVIES